MAIKTIPKKKKWKKAKWLSEEALRIAEKRREVRGKGEKCSVPKIARRNKKAFLSYQCKNKQTKKQQQIEENNRMGKTRSLQEN